MNDFLFGYLPFGVVAVYFAKRAYQLEFEPKKTTIGTLFLYLIGVLLAPITMFAALAFLVGWAFSPDQRTKNVKWPDWWGKHRWNQHLFWRWIWYLGQPPAREDILSGWHDSYTDIPKRWKE